MAKNNIDFDAMDATELNQLIKDAKQALENKQEGAKTQFIEEMRAKASALGLDLSSLLTTPRTNVRKSRTDKGVQVAAKFRSPEGETWTGRGRMPKWLTEAMNHGKSKEDFAV